MNNVCPVCGNVVTDASCACEMCGFKLIGATQAFTAIDQSMLEPQSEPPAVGCQLRVLRGQQIGTIFKLDSDEIEIGRDPHCNIFLNDMTVSRKHATLVKAGTAYKIYDENSFNGVWVNGKAVESAALTPGDQVQIGSFRLVFEQE